MLGARNIQKLSLKALRSLTVSCVVSTVLYSN